MRQGRKRERRSVDRFDAMTEGELVADSVMLYCGNGVDRFGYTSIEDARYNEWRDWVMETSVDELRVWVRRNSPAE